MIELGDLPLDLDGVDVRRLISEDLRKIVSVIGLPAALTVLKAHGGTKIRKPRGLDPMMFRELLGEDAARNLARVFAAREFVTLPKADKILQELRDRAIRADTETSLNALAVRWGLTTRQILNIKRADRGDKFRYVLDAAQRRSLQQDLFTR